MLAVCSAKFDSSSPPCRPRSAASRRLDRALPFCRDGRHGDRTPNLRLSSWLPPRRPAPGIRRRPRPARRSGFSVARRRVEGVHVDVMILPASRARLARPLSVMSYAALLSLTPRATSGAARRPRAVQLQGLVRRTSSRPRLLPASSGSRHRLG